MNTFDTFKVVTLAAVVSFGATYLARPANAPGAARPDQPTFARVMESGTLRCGYVVYAPGTIRDPKTGKLSGIVPEIVESAAKKLNLKVVWAEETAWGSHLEGLSSGRYDMLCSASFTLPSDAVQAEAIGPLYYSGLGVYVRADDDRFTNNLEAINKPETVVSAIDGTIPAIVAAERFPKAGITSHPQMTDYTFNTIDVAEHKADVTFVENYYGADYLAHNPGKLKNIAADKPLRIFHNKMLVHKGEFKLQSMFQNVILGMMNDGEVDEIIGRYERYPGTLYRVAKPYVIGK